MTFIYCQPINSRRCVQTLLTTRSSELMLTKIMGSDGYFGAGGVVVCVIQTQHPEDALRTPWATPSFAMQRALQEDCRRPIRQWAGCARFEQTHTNTHTNNVITHTFPWRSSGDFGEILCNIKDFFFFMTGTPLPKTWSCSCSSSEKKMSRTCKVRSDTAQASTHSCIIYIKADKPLNTLY